MRTATNILVKTQINNQLKLEYNSVFLSGLPPPSVRIKSALQQCPIQAEYFSKQKSSSETQTKGKINDKLLKGLDLLLHDLRPKKYSFITDGIETKTDISKLGLSDNQLKRANKVSLQEKPVKAATSLI
jgi:hypothetical protein